MHDPPLFQLVPEGLSRFVGWEGVANVQHYVTLRLARNILVYRQTHEVGVPEWMYFDCCDCHLSLTPGRTKRASRGCRDSNRTSPRNDANKRYRPELPR